MRKRLQHWLWDGQYKLASWLDDRKHCKLADRLYDLQDKYVEEPGKKLLCALFGHEAHSECGDPAHDCCVWCMKLMPGQAARAVKV